MLPAARHSEQLLEAAAALLDPHERQAQVGDRVAHEVPRPVVDELDQDRPSVGDRLQARGHGARPPARQPPSSTSTARMPVRSVNVGQRRRAHEPPGVDRDEVVAHALDLAEQVTGDDDRDAELRAGPPDERQHLVATGRVEAVRGLVEEQQARVVDERLGELDPLLHAGRVAAIGR